MDLKKVSFKLPPVKRKTVVTPKAKVEDKTDNNTIGFGQKVLAVLCYLGILALIPILWAKKSELLKSHVNSGIVILILWAILLFVFQIPLFGVWLGILLLVGGIIFSIWGIYDAVTSQDAKIPGIEKLAGLF